MKKIKLLIGLIITLSIFIFLSILPYIFLTFEYLICIFILAIYYLLNLVFLIDALQNKRSNRQSKTSWTILFCLPLPIFSLYLVSSKIFLIDQKKLKRLNSLEKNLNKISNNRTINFKINFEIIVGGQDKFPKLINDLESAKFEINFEYFIINDGIIWRKILEILLKKASEGVKINIISDHAGNIQTSEKAYKDLLNIKNIKFVIYNIFYPPFSSGFSNLRSHHKIVTIDNEIAYFGGLNIGDDYSHLYAKYGYWYDIHFRTTGKVVTEINNQFKIDFYRATDEQIFPIFDETPYENSFSKFYNPEDEYLRAFSDGYQFNEPIFLNEFIKLINEAKTSIKIITPYIVLPREIIQAFKQAINRGVKIEIITTGKADKKSAYFVSNYYVNILNNLKINVYRTNNFFMHAKIYVFDQEISIIGTTNLDYRAIYMHFEYNFIFKNKSFVQNFEEMIWSELLSNSTIQQKTKHRLLLPFIKFISPIF